MSNNKQTTALNEHLEWLKEQLQQGIDNGYSETWIFAYQIAIKNAESLIEKEKKQIILTITANLLSDEEIESKYNKFIDTEIQLGFLKQEQGERLKWYYKTYFINNEQK